MKYYYARVSSETHLDRHIELFKEMGATDRTIFQKKSLENLLKIETPGMNF